jgi:hypothetical protein
MLVLLFCLLVNMPSTTLLEELRNNYGACNKSEQLCDKMLAKLKNCHGPTEKGYLGSFTMMKANWAAWPHQKLAYFNEGKDLLEKTIKANPTNIELHFLRYSLQKEIPSFLNYDNKIEDLAYIKKNVASLSDEHLKQKIKSYIK